MAADLGRLLIGICVVLSFGVILACIVNYCVSLI
jgi:hypothetical protein